MRYELARSLARTERARFLIEGLDLEAATDMAGAEWEPFQLAHLNDDGLLRHENKSRQVGWSWLAAAESVANAILTPRTTSLFVSINRDESSEKIRYARQIYEALYPAWRVPIVGEAITAIVFANGSRILSMPQRPIRGKARAWLYMDEFAHYRMDREIYTGAVPVTTKGGRIRIGSTAMGARGMFWEIGEQQVRAYPGYHRARTPWWTVGALLAPEWKTQLREVTRLAPTLPTEERVARFANQRIHDIFDNVPLDDFQQEYECHLPDTLVRLSTGGIRRFIELQVGDRLPCRDRTNGQVRECRVIAFREMGRKPITTVTTETGTTLSASSDHHVYTSQGKLPLASAPDLCYVPTTIYNPDPQAALARLVGFHTGDGTTATRQCTYQRVRDGGTSTYAPYHQVSFYSQRREELERVAVDLVTAGITDKPSSVLFKKGSDPRFDAYQIHLSASASTRFVAAGIPVERKTEIAFDVPAWILNGDTTLQAEYLAGLFGAEGQTPIVSSRSRIRCNTPALTMHKVRREDGERYFGQLVTLCESLGLHASYTAQPSTTGWRFTLSILGGLAGAKEFFASVGYRYATHKEEAAFLWRYYIAAMEYAANMRHEQVKTLREQELSFSEIGARMECSTQQALKLYRAPHRVNGFSGFTEWTQARWRDGALAVTICDRTTSDDQTVYNITVDSPDHSYLLADGLDNYNCAYVDEAAAYISWEDIYGSVLPDDDHDLAWITKTPGDALDAIDQLAAACRRGQISGPLVWGLDVGRKRDLTELVVLELQGDLPVMRALFSLDRQSFESQYAICRALLEKTPVLRGYMDQNGLGMQLAETLHLRDGYGERAMPMIFTVQTKALMATHLKTRFQRRGRQGGILIFNHRDLTYQVHSVRRKITEASNIIFDVEANTRHHADKFWALACANEAAETLLRLAAYPVSDMVAIRTTQRVEGGAIQQPEAPDVPEIGSAGLTRKELDTLVEQGIGAILKLRHASQEQVIEATVVRED